MKKCEDKQTNKSNFKKKWKNMTKIIHDNYALASSTPKKTLNKENLVLINDNILIPKRIAKFEATKIVNR